ncbi:alpha/beta fold hydrolase [Gordonia sp. NPDC058843]|uniref:alpha/beta fold hydrolase n=1 Tax=Gordonia sp. NPDC058843 TaxID=3346648 RepID=UPI0036B1C233
MRARSAPCDGGHRSGDLIEEVPDRVQILVGVFVGRTRRRRDPFGTTRVNIIGTAGTPPLILLPGGGATSMSWVNVVDRLARTRRVHALDLIGDVGRSRVSRPPQTTGDLAGQTGAATPNPEWSEMICAGAQFPTPPTVVPKRPTSGALSVLGGGNSIAYENRSRRRESRCSPAAVTTRCPLEPADEIADALVSALEENQT